MRAWNYIKNDVDQETGKEYSTIVQIIVKDDRGKAIAWLSVSYKMTCYPRIWLKNSINSQFAFFTQSAVCILYPVYSLHFVRTGLVLLFLFEQASSPDRNVGAPKKNSSETILAAMIAMWNVCWRAYEEKYNDIAIITLY